MFFEILWPSRFPRAAASVPSPSSGNASTLPGRPCRSHRHIAWQPWQPAWPPAWQPATVRGFFSGLPTWDASRDHPSQAAACEETSHGSSAMMWDYLRCELWGCEQDWTSETCEKILQNQDVPRCPKMCQDVPRLQLFFHHSYSSFAFLLENVKRSKLRTSCFFTAAVAVPDFCFLMFPSFLDVPSFHWLCSLASSLSAWAFTTLSAQKSEREHLEHAVSSAKTLQKLRIFI